MAYNLNFHQTFKPERNHISSLLSIEHLNATKEEISHQFSIPTGSSSGKVEVNLLYSQAAGLLTFTKKKELFIINRTHLGDVIYENDSFLEHELTQLLFHYMFCSKNSELVLWELLFTNYHKGSYKVEVTDFRKFAEKTLSAKNIKFAPLWGTYISEDPLINIGVLKHYKKGEYHFGEISIISHYFHWYALFLYHFLQEFDNNRNNFTLEELQFSGFPQIFGWDSGNIRKILELIESKNYLNLNKQFSNYHIYLNKDLDELINTLTYI